MGCWNRGAAEGSGVEEEPPEVMLQAENSWHRDRKNGRVENLRQVERYSNHTNRNKEKKGEESRRLKPRAREPLGTPKSRNP